MGDAELPHRRLDILIESPAVRVVARRPLQLRKVANPKLIERPIVINNGKAALGRPPETILDII